MRLPIWICLLYFAAAKDVTRTTFFLVDAVFGGLPFYESWDWAWTGLSMGLAVFCMSTLFEQTMPHISRDPITKDL